MHVFYLRFLLPPSMSSHHFSTTSALVILLISVLLILFGLPPTLSNELYSGCSSPFSCGSIGNVSFPFWGGNRAAGCGYPSLELICVNSTIAEIVIANVNYRVLAVYPDVQVIKISRQDYSSGLCSPEFTNSTLDPTLFDLAPGYINFTMIYGCPSTGGLANIPGKFSCSINGVSFRDSYSLLGEHGPGVCFGSVVVPVSQALITDVGNSSNSLPMALQEGFEVRLKVDYGACEDCTRSKGVCGYDSSGNQTTCYCANQSSRSPTCSSSSAQAPGPEKQGMPLFQLFLP